MVMKKKASKKAPERLSDSDTPRKSKSVFPEFNLSGRVTYVKLAPDFKDRFKRLEDDVLKRLKKYPSNKELLGMSKALACLKGNMKVEDVFQWDRI